MIKSMTAFSSQSESQQNIILSWEIRSVNHRYLDVSTYLPAGFSAEENAFKEMIREHLGRGKVDAKLVYELLGESHAPVISINQNAVTKLLDAQRKLTSLSEEATCLSVNEILSWPGVIKEQQDDYSAFFKACGTLLKKTLSDLVETRKAEGERMTTMLLNRCDVVLEIVQSVRSRRLQVVALLKQKLMNKVTEISADIDNKRLEQELVYHAQRLDVDEELDRLDSHITEVKAVLKKEEPVGRRLDFLMQELNREANTLGSKANDAKTTKAAIDLKVIIEQMREQVMNIE